MTERSDTAPPVVRPSAAHGHAGAMGYAAGAPAPPPADPDLLAGPPNRRVRRHRRGRGACRSVSGRMDRQPDQGRCAPRWPVAGGRQFRAPSWRQHPHWATRATYAGQRLYRRQFHVECLGTVTIGHDVAIVRCMTIMDTDHHTLTSARSREGPVRIGNHVWIGANVTIVKGGDDRQRCDRRRRIGSDARRGSRRTGRRHTGPVRPRR